jgi:hypothetical protein
MLQGPLETPLTTSRIFRAQDGVLVTDHPESVRLVQGSGV